MQQGIAEDLPLAGKDCVDEDGVGGPSDQPSIVDVKATAAGYETELRIEDEDDDRTQPENRRRVAEQSDDTRQVSARLRVLTEMSDNSKSALLTFN